MLTQNKFAKWTDPKVYEELDVVTTVPAFLEYIEKKYAKEVAIFSMEESHTYEELIKDARKVSGLLKEKGIEERVNIGIYAHNTYDLAKAYLGVLGHGDVAVMLPIQLDEKTVFGCTMKYQVKALIYEDSNEEKVAIAKKMNPGIVYIKMSEFLGAKEGEFAKDIKEEDRAEIMFTGGTTGRSKGAILSHLAVMTGALRGCFGTPKIMRQRYYSLMPMTHIFGLNRDFMSVLYSGSSVMFSTAIGPQMIKEMMFAKPTVLVIVPALCELLLKFVNGKGMGIVGGELHTIICGAAVTTPYVLKGWADKGVLICPGYGLTESTNLVSGNPISLEKPESVGLIYEGLEYKIIPETGELWLKGPGMLEAYYNEPEENAMAFEDGWFKTGDVVRFDEDGYLYITGRIKEVIILSNGENVFPAPIEEKINDHDSIMDSLVYAKRREDGKVILACEILPRSEILEAKYKPENVQAFFEGIVKEVNKGLLPYEQIVEVIVRTEDFKRTGAMKIIRPKEIL